MNTHHKKRDPTLESRCSSCCASFRSLERSLASIIHRYQDLSLGINFEFQPCFVVKQTCLNAHYVVPLSQPCTCIYVQHSWVGVWCFECHTEAFKHSSYGSSKVSKAAADCLKHKAFLDLHINASLAAAE